MDHYAAVLLPDGNAPQFQAPNLLFLIDALCASFAAVRSAMHGHTGRFRWWTAYLVFVGATMLWSSVVNEYSGLYRGTYYPIEISQWLLAVLVVRGMSGLIFRDYPGLQSAGRWAVNGAVIASALLAFALKEMLPPGYQGHHPGYLYFSLLDRLIFLTLSLVAILLIFCLSRYPLRLERTVTVTAVTSTGLFVVAATVRTIDLLTPGLFLKVLDNAEVAIEALAYFSWGLLAFRAPHSIPHSRNADPSRESELLHQLDAMNALLTRAARP